MTYFLMKNTLRLVIGFLLCTAFAASASAMEIVPLAQWEPERGDRFLVDTERNMGYLIHRDGSYAVTYLATGQNRWVHYLGRSYVATTPQAEWVVRDMNIQSDRRTFGPRGIFLRLFRNGSEYTRYGIHSNASIQWMLLQPQRYFSMGCILVSDPVLDLLNETFELDGELRVTTVYGFDENRLWE